MNVERMLQKIDAGEPPIIVNRDGKVIARIDGPTSELKSLKDKAMQLSIAHPALDRAMPGYSQLVHRAWVEVAVTNRRESETTLLRRNIDGKSGGGTLVCGLKTYGVNKAMPHTIDRARAPLRESTEPRDMAIWLQTVLTGKRGKLTGDGWRIDPAPLGDDHWDDVNVPDYVHCIEFKLTVDGESEYKLVKLWVQLIRQEPVIYDIMVDSREPPRDTRLWYLVAMLLDGVQYNILQGEWRPTTATVVYHTAKSSELYKRKGWSNGADTHHAFGDATPPTDGVLGKTIDIAHYNFITGVHHGRIAAGDVPPALQVVSGLNGAKGVAMSTITVGSNHGYLYHNLLNCSTIHKIAYLNYGVKHAPCVRDGLMAVALMGALAGDGHGNVMIDTTENVRFSAKTAWCRRETETTDGSWVITRDVVSTFRAMSALAQMQGWIVDEDPSALIIRASAGGVNKKIQVVEGPSNLARWAELLDEPDLERAWLDTSELGLDYWCSGVARYLMRLNTSHGRIHGLTGKFVQQEAYIFSHIKKLVTSENKGVIDYVVDLERINMKVDEADMTYIYAAGIARIQDGVLTGSTLVIDDNVDLVNMLDDDDLKLNAFHRQNARTLITSDGPKGDPGSLVSKLRLLMEKHPTVRVFGKGIDQDDAAIQGGRGPGSKYFRNQKTYPNTRKLREIGSLMQKVEGLANAAKWPEDHNPAREAVLFAHAAGMIAKLPGVETVGTTPANEILVF